MLYTTRQYPCGCKAEGPGDVPAYCSEHGLPPELQDPIKVMERGRFLANYVDDAQRYRWLREHYRFNGDSVQEIWFSPEVNANKPENLDTSVDHCRREP